MPSLFYRPSSLSLLLNTAISSNQACNMPWRSKTWLYIHFGGVKTLLSYVNLQVNNSAGGPCAFLILGGIAPALSYRHLHANNPFLQPVKQYRKSVNQSFRSLCRLVLTHLKLYLGRKLSSMWRKNTRKVVFMGRQEKRIGPSSMEREK